MTDKKYVIRFLGITLGAIIVISFVYALFREYKDMTAQAEIYSDLREIFSTEETVVVDEEDIAVDYDSDAWVDGYILLKNLNLEEHKYFDEYIETIGTKEKLAVDYVKVTMMNGVNKQEQYVYDSSATDWVWDEFLGQNCTYKGEVSCDCCVESSTYNQTRKWVDVKICIRNTDNNSVYYITVSMHGTINVINGSEYLGTLEYEIDESKLLSAFQTLVDDYQAYEIRTE